MTLQTPPISGGVHQISGLFMCCSDHNEMYAAKNKSLYKLTTQICTLKQSISSKISLMNAKSDPFKIKIQGKLETPADYVTKYDKEDYLQSIK